ncbi:MAG: hypothetical protein ACI93R_002774 [Flavobacteriales bacterium]|jgi:hypothetical protein
MSDIYSAPESELSKTAEGSDFGSVERGIAGDYELKFGDILKEAWALKNGSKSTILLAILFLILVNIGVSFAANFISALIFGPIAVALVSQVVIMIVTTPLTVGVMIIGIRSAANTRSSSGSIFNYYHKIIPLFLTMLLMYVLIILGTILLVIPGIYLMIAYAFALPLVVEKNLSPWQALETSRKAVTHKWFVIFFTFITISFAVTLSAIPLLIGLIWTIPWAYLVLGTQYRTLFGIEKTTLESE